MLILGIETSCDETAASLLEVKNNKIRVLSNVISSQVKLHAPYGGVVPSLASREHVKNLPRVLKLALKTGNCTLKNIDLIAVTRGPGLISSLLVGTTFAKTLAWKYKKPIIGVNHMEGHISSNWLPPITGNQKFEYRNSKQIRNSNNQNSKSFEFKIWNLDIVSDFGFRISNLFPALCLIVSGGHTELVLMKDFGNHKLIGQTLDDAAGEAFDKIARILGLGYPGGPAIDAEAAKMESGKIPDSRFQIPNSVKLPRPMLNSKNFDFSFAGLKTAVLYLVRDLTKTYAPSEIRTAIAAEAQKAIVDVLVAKTIKASEKYKTKSIMLSGGVSANKLLRTELEKAAKQIGMKFFKPQMEYTTDNAAMIALAGYFSAKNKKTDWKSVQVDANLSID